MNLIYTSVGKLDTFASQARVPVWRSRHHIVETMPMHRVTRYLRFDPGSALALIDAIICAADTEALISWDSDTGVSEFNFPLEQALLLADDVRNLPESCAMRDGRKWRSIPFIIFPNPAQLEAVYWAQQETHATILPYVATRHPMIALHEIQRIVEEDQDQVLRDYATFGILVRFENGHVQVSPALRKKNPTLESAYYYAPADRRNTKGWVTVRRDSQGLRHDVELFEQLIEKNVTEGQLHAFFEQHPAFLMQARMGIPISHSPNFANPKDHKPDFALSPILGPQDDHRIELLELKRPGEKILNKGLHRGFSSKVHRAVDQVRDYRKFLNDPANLEAVLQALGYLPQKPKLAVLIGRSPRNRGDNEAFLQRQSELDVQVVTYDEILSNQTKQLNSAPFDWWM